MKHTHRPTEINENFRATGLSLYQVHLGLQRRQILDLYSLAKCWGLVGILSTQFPCSTVQTISLGVFSTPQQPTQFNKHPTGTVSWLTCTAQCRAVLKSLSTRVGSAPLCSRVWVCWGLLWNAAQWSEVIPWKPQTQRANYCHSQEHPSSLCR